MLTTNPFRRAGSSAAWALILGIAVPSAMGQIPKPDDAPLPLSVAESAASFRLPAGFRMELVASEPLVAEPSGVCWDARGRLFVCELHGYNVEGQLDIEELNKTGQLDHEVRRLDANPAAKQAARAALRGSVKLLSDTDGDGVMDRAQLWADGLPPCYGICPARDGILAACAPDIVFLADRDGDGRAEVREVLYTGFAVGALERGINCPQWGLDDWILVGRGHGGGHITGPHLAQPVDLPNTDFRLKTDGTAIEPITGATHTIGFAQSPSGERIVATTNTPGIAVAPIDWRYLARNPDVAVSGLEQAASNYNTCFPASRPHPWRTRRAEDPAFAKFYTDRYGKSESAPNGYFTSGCSPLIYQSDALPLGGEYLVCEPAQNLIHRAHLERSGPMPHLTRAPGEEMSELLASTDPWFHPISLAHAPDGSLLVTDFYREIIEDYSAIPRYLQQQYELTHGQDRGRLWRLVHRDAAAQRPADMSHLTAEQLVQELASPNFWRRRTAQRLLTERRDAPAALLEKFIDNGQAPATVLGALYVLADTKTLRDEVVLAALSHPDAGVQINALKLAEHSLGHEPILVRAFKLTASNDSRVVLQAVLTLGESSDPRTLRALVGVAWRRGDVPWMNTAILSSLGGRCGAMATELLRTPIDIGPAKALLEPLGAAIGARRNPAEISEAVVQIGACPEPALAAQVLQGLRSSFRQPTELALAPEAQQRLKQLAAAGDAQLSTPAGQLIELWRIETPAERAERLARASKILADIQLSSEERLAAVAQLARENDEQTSAALLAAVPTSTPRVREAILEALVTRRDRAADVLAALEAKRFSPALLSALQRTALLEHPDADMRRRAAAAIGTSAVDPAVLARYADALKSQRDTPRGGQLFAEKCGVCHQAHGVGVAVGPDLSAEFQRAETTLIQDILAPSSAITAGYVTYLVTTIDGDTYTGLLTSESAGSITLKQPQGKMVTLLRKQIDELRASNISLMPDDLARVLTPQDVADIVAWLRSPPAQVILLDENPAMATVLNEGAGRAVFDDRDAQRGSGSLEVFPPQRFSAQIEGWRFAIREKPGPGEFRYLRFAWKSSGARGLMIELADRGRWPDASSSRGRYYAGENTTGWQAVEQAPQAPDDWTVVTRDLWQDFGDMTLTGIAPTVCGGAGRFDCIELLSQRPE